jgi:hypothetical protein
MCTAPILDEIEINLKQEKQILFPKSSIGIVINYALTIVENLKWYIYERRFEIENNIENAIRLWAKGIKKYFF